MEPAALAALPDEQLLEVVQRQTFNFFWDGAHPVSGLAPDRCTTRAKRRTTRSPSAAPASESWRSSWPSSAAGSRAMPRVERLDRMLDLLIARRAITAPMRIS